MKHLDGRVAVITGAASGIGAALAQTLAARGCRLALADVDEAGLDAVAAGLPGAETLLRRVDVRHEDQVAGLVEAVVSRFGAAHLVVNNAGLTVTGRFLDTSAEDFRRVVDVNLWGVIYGCRHFLPVLLAQDQGHVVNLSSMFGIVGVPGQSAYCVTKYGVRGLSEALWEELAGTSVGVTVVHPGGVRTNIVRAAGVRDPKTRERMVRYFDERTMPAEVAAERIVRAVEQGAPRLVLGKDALLGDALRRLAPVQGNRLLGRQLRRMLGL